MGTYTLAIRTPLHVATFRRRPDVAKILIAAGADTALLDNQKYDAVTIASVQDDEETLKAFKSLAKEHRVKFHEGDEPPAKRSKAVKS